MALLIGNETAEATVKAFGKEKPFACKFEALQTGTLEEILLKCTGEIAETEVDIGIYDDNAGKPGTLKAHKKTGKIKVGEEKTLTASGFSVALVKGTKYHLAGVPNLGQVKIKYKKEAGKEEVETSTTANAELNEGKTWTKTAESLNMTLWALGTESGGVAAVAGVAKIKLFAGSAPAQTQGVAALSQIRLKDTAAMAQMLLVGGTTKVSFKDTASLLQTLAIAGVSGVRFQTAGQPAIVMSIAGASKVRFAGTAAISLVEAGGRKVALFIFED